MINSDKKPYLLTKNEARFLRAALNRYLKSMDADDRKHYAELWAQTMWLVLSRILSAAERVTNVWKQFR